MRPGQKSVTNGIENFLCPFTDMYITQGSNMKPTHMGILANDVRGLEKGVRYPYYAPCKVKVIKTYPSSGQVMWQSVNKVRFANGRIDYATFMTAHDDSMNVRKGQVFNQGVQIGNMGSKGYATGVHCHIQISQSSDVSWWKNAFGLYCFNNEYEPYNSYFIDGTNIIYGMEYPFKSVSDIVNPNIEYVNLPPSITSWRVYNIDSSPIKKNAIAKLKPKKFGGLTYKIIEYRDYNTTVVIDTHDYGRVKIYIDDTAAVITDEPIYEYGNY